MDIRRLLARLIAAKHRAEQLELPLTGTGAARRRGFRKPIQLSQFVIRVARTRRR